MNTMGNATRLPCDHLPTGWLTTSLLPRCYLVTTSLLPRHFLVPCAYQHRCIPFPAESPVARGSAQSPFGFRPSAFFRPSDFGLRIYSPPRHRFSRAAPPQWSVSARLASHSSVGGSE